MNEQPMPVDPSNPASSEADLLFQIKRIQQQLVFLEKKIDTLINRPQERPPREEHFSKPFRPPYRPSYRHDKGGHYDRPREGREGGYDKSRPYEKRGGEGREGGFDKNRRFEKRPSGEHRGFSYKKKPFYVKNKNRG
jgi:hypothetical protein